MKKKYRDRKISGTAPRNTLVLKILIAVISCLILWDVAGPFGLWTLHRMQKQRQKIYTCNMQIALDNTIIEENIKKIHSDRQYQSKIIRKNLGWVRDNEILFRFMNEKKEGR